MRAGTRQMDEARVAGLIAAATITLAACGTARNEQAPAAPPGTVAGGMDSGGVLAGKVGNTSPNGVVTTNLGDFTDVRSDTPLSHIFQPASAGVPEKLFLRHYLETPTGQVVVFEFDYTSGVRSFPIAENGFLAMKRNGTELIAKAGDVTIEPVDTGALKVSFAQITMAAEDDDNEPPAVLETIGSGRVLGPLRRSCLDAGDVPESEEAEAAEPTSASSMYDAAWIAAFCDN